ncbi:MAG: PEP-CTERM sorting domain-containing protein [Phycisphaeraceae bacterium]|nr:PEP-CTERM sorting domain-containing protein [Phycisphaeraceae bacterium]
MTIPRFTALAAIASALVAGNASAVTQFDQNVTSDIIFGSGNANGGFTTTRANGVELGIRGKLRFDANNSPQDIYNSNGAGTYTFQAGPAPTGFSWQQNSPTTPVWSFDWSVNTNYDGNGANLDTLTYEIGIDFDPGAGTNFLSFDPITGVNGATGTVQWDHGIGTNATGNGDGTSISNNADDAAGYATLIADNNLAQNSWNYEFFNNTPFDGFDPNDTGVYDLYIIASDLNGEVARVDVSIQVVPEPTSLALLAIGGLAVLRRRR